MASSAARAIFRSCSASGFKATSRLATGARAAPARSPFRISTKPSFSQCAVRIPVEMSFCVESMLPFHSATSSALMTSMLSVSPRSYGWLSEVQDEKEGGM
ncbi:protein NUCLEAR FUSION DEFECTIVE 6, chloroplastic/mitochondrial-like isoform X2 [Momordica charantia]|uniref:Protein NUCLEAR FUSION DEFECTIVE 6, chloroplastic/mitochondrial-like isoform X2 n=1 Tax=Momordica charantia TaxID=3673 RepID=A0A6J1C2B4_MOMCH|nr:protein NUCLEAR FUSION DEFECTIVE 6, chloroplastic/mitochondrial-like isoform X2 [Momordica charantia]